MDVDDALSAAQPFLTAHQTHVPVFGGGPALSVAPSSQAGGGSRRSSTLSIAAASTPRRSRLGGSIGSALRKRFSVGIGGSSGGGGGGNGKVERVKGGKGGKRKEGAEGGQNDATVSQPLLLRDRAERNKRYGSYRDEKKLDFDGIDGGDEDNDKDDKNDDDDDNDDDGSGYYRHVLRDAHKMTKSEGRRREQDVTARMRRLTCVAAIGGMLSGYNTGVISGAMLPLRRVFALSAEEEEMIVSATILSAFVSSLAGAPMNNTFGRRPTIMASAAIFVTGAVLMAMSASHKMLVLGEIILGIGVGIESLTSPMYIAEVAKPSIRGTLVSMYGLLMCFGQFFAGMVDGVFGGVAGGWRFMFGLAAVPGVVMFHGFLVSLPESPSWLIAAGLHSEAEAVLKTIRDTDTEVMEEMMEIEDSLNYTGGSENDDNGGDDKQQLQQRWQWRREDDDDGMGVGVGVGVGDCDGVGREDDEYDDGKGGGYGNGNGNGESSMSARKRFRKMMRHPPTRRAMVLGCGLMVLQQICGPNVVMYYAASIYKMAGFSELTSIWLSGFTAFAQILGLGLSVYFVETAGRRALVLVSLSLVSVTLMGMGLAFHMARVYSPPIEVESTLTNKECASQRALVWSGVTSYCYDCAQIEGCGYCGGACVRGDALGPFDGPEACPGGDTSDWAYDACENPFGWVSIVSMVLYLLVFGVGMAGLPWTINSEIYPIQHRSFAVGISTATNWIFNLMISSTFLTISSPRMLTAQVSFWLYSFLSILGVVWLYFTLPETKGLSLEEIEEQFTKPWDFLDKVGGKRPVKIMSTSKLSSYGSIENEENIVKEQRNGHKEFDA